MEIIQLCENFSELEPSQPYTFVNNRAGTGPIPIQIATTNDFIGSIILEGTLSDENEVSDGIVTWSPIFGAFWTESNIDALLIQVTHIRVRLLDYISGSVSIRLGY